MFHQSDKTAYINTHWKKKKRIYRLERPPNREYISEKGELDEDDDHLIYKFKLKMANTLSVMTNVLRNVVSKKRIRYKENGFDLDLAYICDNIIAMGFPADNLESIYRNRSEDVFKFLEEHHRDHYKIYNLCLERNYDKNKFHGRVAVYPFEDHNPPTIELIQQFCNDVHTWLGTDSKNVAAIHCKAGKGRTGTMICCYLLYCGLFRTPQDALAYYDSKRTKDGKGVTIPSQRRYVQYFSKLLQTRQPYEKSTLQFCEIRFTEASLLHNQGMVHCSISVLQDTHDNAVKVETLHNLCTDFRKSYTVDLRNCSLDVTGDIQIELNSKSLRKKIFHFWFNTYFIAGEADIEGEGDDAKYIYTLNKWEIDDVHKDKEHKCYPENFKVHLVFYKNAAINRTSQASNLASDNRTSSSNHGRRFMTHNSYPLTTAVNSVVAPMALSTQLNNSGSNLSFNCDQRSSSSSASVSSLVGGGGSGSDSTKICGNLFGTENRLKLNNDGNMDLKAHPLSLPPSNNTHRSAGIVGNFNEVIGTDTLVHSTLSEYNNFSTANNISIKLKLLNQHHDIQKQQQQQQKYQLTENNVSNILPPNLNRGSKSINTLQSKNHITQSTTNQVGFEKFVSGREFGNNASSSSDIKNNLSTNNGSGENDHHEYDYDVERDAFEDDDAEEDWESGESRAISLLHLEAPIKSNISTDNILTKTLHKTKHLSPPQQTYSQTVMTHDITKTELSSTCAPTSKSTPTSLIYTQELTGLPSINYAPFTNNNTISKCSLLSKSKIGGENNGNNVCTRNVVKETEDGGDDDNSKKVHSDLGPRPNGNAVMKEISYPENYDDTTKTTTVKTSAEDAENTIVSSPHALFAVPVPPISRNKFFSFNKTRTTQVKNVDPNDTVTVITQHTTHPKPPFFRRKSFKSANSNSNAVGGDIGYTSSNDDPMSVTSVGCSGLAESSKQNLKTKLKKKRFKLAQKFQKLHNFLRTDPDEFCENFVQQTIVRRNSTCSLTNRNHKTVMPITSATTHQLIKLSTSPLSANNLINYKPNTKFPNALDKVCLIPSSFEQLAIQSSSSISPSATASNASLGSSADCDLGCDCDDFYSSICDNQLSFDNSPCKSPRSLADIALMSGGRHMGSAGNILSSSLQQRTTLQQCRNQNQHQNNQRLPFVYNSKIRGGANSRLLKDHQKAKHETCNDVVVVAGKPAIGFNVSAIPPPQLPLPPSKLILKSSDCVDVRSENNAAANQSHIKSVINGFPLNNIYTAGTKTTKNNSEHIEDKRTSAYFTPPITEIMNNDVVDSCSSSSSTSKPCTTTKTTPFVFPTLINELKSIENPSNTMTDSKESSLATSHALSLLIVKNKNFNPISSVAADENDLVSKNTHSPDDDLSLKSIENNGYSSAASISNGTNSAGTGSSSGSSGLSATECCHNYRSSNSNNAICNCNPLVKDLERYAARIGRVNLLASKTINVTSITEENNEQVEEPCDDLRAKTTLEAKDTATDIRK